MVEGLNISPLASTLTIPSDFNADFREFRVILTPSFNDSDSPLDELRAFSSPSRTGRIFVARFTLRNLRISDRSRAPRCRTLEISAALYCNSFSKFAICSSRAAIGSIISFSSRLMSSSSSSDLGSGSEWTSSSVSDTVFRRKPHSRIRWLFSFGVEVFTSCFLFTIFATILFINSGSV